MKKNNTPNRRIFALLSAGFCASTLALTDGVVTNAYAASRASDISSGAVTSSTVTSAVKEAKTNSSVEGGIASSHRSPIQPAPTQIQPTLTPTQPASTPIQTAPAHIIDDATARKMAGCEAEVQTIKGVKYLVIKPKNAAESGIISASYRPEEFETLHNKLISDEASGATLKFEGKVYGYHDLHLWQDPSDVIKNISLFSNSKIKSLGNIDTFDVSNVTKTTKLFKGCTNLESLDGLENWNIKNVTEMKGMFEGCEQITNLNALQNWDTSKVFEMDSAFKDCKKLKDIQGLRQWNVSTARFMSEVFSGCESLESLDALSTWDTPNAAYMDKMFFNCKNLKNITPLANWKTDTLKSVKYMFSGCTSLTGSNKLNTMSDNTSNTWNTKSLIFLQSMFESAGSKDLVLDMSNKKFSSGLSCSNLVLAWVSSFNDSDMFKNFNGIVIANNWTFSKNPGDPGVSNTFKTNLLSGGTTATDTFGEEYITHKSLFFTDNDVLLNGMKDAVYYEKPIIVNYQGKEIKLYLPAAYDSRINGSVSTDPVAIMKHHIQKAMKKALDDLREAYPNANLPEDFEFVPFSSDEPKDAFSVFDMEYHLAKIETVDVKGKMKYEADNTLKFNEKKKIKDFKDGKKKVKTGKVVNGVWSDTATDENVLDAFNDGLTKVGNVKVEHEDNKTITTTYDVDSDTGDLKNPKVHTSMPWQEIENNATSVNPKPQPPTPKPSPDPTPEPTLQPGSDTPDDNPDNGSGDEPGDNPDNNTDNNPNDNPDNGSGNTPGNNPNNNQGSNPGNNPNNPGNGSNNGNNTNGSGDGTGNGNTKNGGNGNGGTGNGSNNTNGNNTNGSNTNRNGNGGSTGASGLNTGASGSNSSNSAKSNDSDSTKDSAKDHSDSSDSAKDSAKDSDKDSKDSKDSAKSSASSSAKSASSSSNVGLIASIVAALAAIVGGFLFFILFGKKKKKNRGEDEN